ncbi:MAG TPA: recombinase, partial [Lachnospiraceae bacterium]|nr:recombinase [Lachnospiraceae bacterium]
MGRKHIPFGYRIENGAAAVIPEKAVQVRKIYDEYLAGKTYEEA